MCSGARSTWNHLEALAFQFPQITEIEPHYNGSCDRVAGIVEAGNRCLVARQGTAGWWGDISRSSVAMGL